MANRRVLVSGLPDGTTATQLTIHFQSVRASGGGDIANVELVEDRRAVITFEEEEAALRVLQQGSHRLQNCHLQVTPVPSMAAFSSNQRSELDSATAESDGFPGQSEDEWSENKHGFCKRRYSGKPPVEREITAATAAIKRQKTKEFRSSENEHDVTEHCTVKVTGLPDGVSKDSILNYFENVRRSHGGPVSNVNMKPEIQMCLVTFESSDDAKRTLEQVRHVLDGVNLEVSLLDDSKDMEPDDEDSVAEPSLAIRVSGLLARTTDDSVLNYFENSRRSGGGDISTIERNDGVALITFTEVKDVQRLLERPHCIDSQPLTVMREPPKRKVPPDPLRLLVQGLNIKTTKDCLRFYLEKFIDVDVADVSFGCQGDALVTFSAEPDFTRLFDGVSKDAKRLEGVKPELRRLPLCSCILVKGLNEATSEDTIELYFENKRRSGGNNVTRVEKHRKNQALVYYDDPASLETVIQKTHTLEGAQLSVRRYYPFFEESGTDPQINCAAKNQVKTVIDPYVISYILERHNIELETLLEEHNASLSLDAERSTVTISPLDKSEDQRPLKERAESIERFLNDFTRFDIALASETFDGVKERWEGLVSTQRLANVVVSFDGTSRLVQIIGKREDVEKSEKELREIIRIVEDDTALKKSIVQSVEDGIPQARLSLLQMSDFCKRLKNGNQHLKISFDLENEKLHLEGPKEVIQDATVQIFKFTSKVVEKLMKFPSEIIQVLKKASVSTFIEDSLRQNGIQAIVRFPQTENPIEVQIIGVNSESTLRAEKLLKDIVHEESIVLRPENIAVVESPQWKHFKSSLISPQGRLHPLKVGITLVTDSNTLWVRGICEDVKECIQEIRNHLEVNTILYHFVPLHHGFTTFLFKVWKSKIDDVKKGLSTHSVDMRVAPDRNGIEISGTAEGLEKGIPRIQKLIQAVQRDSVAVDKPGMKKFFLQGKGSKLLKSIEDENHCVVETSESAAAGDLAVTKSEIMPEDTTGEFICSYTTPEGKKICVFKDDLTKHHVDAIVNAANEDLQHIGGLAAKIVRVGGREIQTACDDFVRDNGGALLPGHAMVTKPGRLPCKQVIHVVGPKWNAEAERKRKLGKATREEGYLRYAVLNALKMAKALRSIAIPAVSSGVYGFPRNLCASVIQDAVLEFCKENPTCNLSEIHLTNYDDPTVRVFVEELKRRFSQEKSFVDKQRAGLVSTEKRFVGERPRLYAGSTAGGWTERLPITFKTPDGICITVKSGDLAKEEAEILVGTASSDLDLNQNPCARALGQAAGATLQGECTKNGPVPVGNIAVIFQPGKLKCRAVIFAICSSWKGGKGEKVLKTLVNKCLEEAEKMKASSIAFPAIGTGTLQFPQDRVANIYFDAVASYSQTHPSTQLKAVKFVLFDQDIPTVKAFEAEVARRVQNAPMSGRKAVGFSGRPSSSKVYAFSPVKERGSGLLETNVGSLCFQVQKGDITEESTEAIVIVSNAELDIARGGGAGAAILRLGGNSIQDECSLQGVQTPGSIVVTKAGGLKTGSIFHAIPLPSEDIQVTILKCLQEAEKRGILSISFPAIGTGNLGISAKSCAQAMLTAVSEFSVQSPTCVQLVRTTIFQPEMLKDFRSAMKEASGEIKSDGTGTFWSFVSRFKRFVGFGNTEEAIESPLSTTEADEREMYLFVFAGCKKDLHGAKTALNNLMIENCTRKVIENKAISDLSSRHMQQIKTLELKHHTMVSIETSVDRIVVRGQPEDVMNTMGEIHEIFHSVKENEHKRRRAELLAKNVQWLFKDGSKFEECGLNQNFQIESAYEEKKRTTTIAFGDAKFELNFKNMTMKDLADGKITEVRRIDHSEGVQLPNYWASQPKDQAGKDVPVHLFELSSTNNPQEFKDVSDHFMKNGSNTIVKIERVQNVALYKTYAIRRKAMDEAKGSNEKKLFHGTPGQNCEQINHKGFNRSFCGKNATMYGNGVYFAKDAAYSARPQYSPADTNGLRYIYLARVLVGEFTTGSQGLLMPPPKNPSVDPTDTYDTVVDNLSNPGIFVAFFDWQCYPEYLITFR